MFIVEGCRLPNMADMVVHFQKSLGTVSVNYISWLSEIKAKSLPEKLFSTCAMGNQVDINIDLFGLQ